MNALPNRSHDSESEDAFDTRMRDCYSGTSVLVAGADGLIGSHLCHRLVELGAHLSVFTRRSDSRAAQVADRSVCGDFADPIAIREALQNQQVVFDCIGSVSAVSSMENGAKTMRDECAAHVAFFEACSMMDPSPVVVFPSSRLVYGVPVSLPVSEQHPVNPASYYALAKLTVERFLELSHRSRGLRSRTFRLSNPYAERADIDRCHYNVVTRFASMIARGESVEIYGDGSQKRDYIAVCDVVNAFLAGGSDQETGAAIYNLGGPRSISIRESVKLMERSVGNSCARFVPWPEGDLRVETGDYCSDISKLTKRYALPAFVDPEVGLHALVLSLSEKDSEEPSPCVR